MWPQTFYREFRSLCLIYRQTPTLFCSHYINIRLCFPRIRTWLPRGHSINTAWQATWLLRSAVNSLGLLGVKASVFQQLWGMIRVHRSHCDCISLRWGLFFHLKVQHVQGLSEAAEGKWGEVLHEGVCKKTIKQDLQFIIFINPFLHTVK